MEARSEHVTVSIPFVYTRVRKAHKKIQVTVVTMVRVAVVVVIVTFQQVPYSALALAGVAL